MAERSTAGRSLGGVVIGLAGAIALAGCAAAPLAGQWQGTADTGPVAAWSVELAIDARETQGTVRIAEDGKTWRQFNLCRIARKGRAIELEYDAARPACEPEGTAPSDRVVLRGTVGEAVLWGEAWRGNQKEGFFRAFAVTVPALAESASGT